MRQASAFKVHGFLVGIALALVACKSEQMERSAVATSKALVAEEPKPAPYGGPAAQRIPRVEYPNDGQVPPSFEVTEEAAIATDVTGIHLHLPPGLKAAGQAASIRADAEVSDAAYSSVRMVIARSDAEPMDNLVVVYKLRLQSGEKLVGLIPKKELELQEGSVSFQVRGPGTYQAALTPILVDTARQLPLPSDNTPYLQFHSAFDTQGQAHDVVLDGATAYVADGDAIEVLSWSLTSGFRSTSRVAGSGTIRAILKGGQRIYVAAGTAGIGVMELTTPLQLRFGEARGVTQGIAAAGNLNNIYLTQESNGLNNSQNGISRYDIQELQPQWETTGIVGSVQNPLAPIGIQIVGTFAYTVSRTGVHVYDINQNDRFILMSQLPLDGTGERVAHHGMTLYATERSSGIRVINLENQAAIAFQGRIALPNVIDIATQDRFLVAVNSSSQLSLYDISQPSNPVLIHQTVINGMPQRVKIYSGTVWVTTGSSGVSVFKIESTRAP